MGAMRVRCERSLYSCLLLIRGETMAEPIVINAETREITVPESERSFGVAGEHNVARKHFRINGRIVDGNDLAVGFAWKVCTENSAKQPNEYPIDSIIADSDGIEFDWLVGQGRPHIQRQPQVCGLRQAGQRRGQGTARVAQSHRNGHGLRRHRGQRRGYRRV